MSRHLYAVILAGGSGTRFGLTSRERFPKQLLQIIGEETLIQQTVRRVLKVVPTRNVCVVPNAFQAETIKLQLTNWENELADHFVLEPADQLLKRYKRLKSVSIDYGLRERSPRAAVIPAGFS